MKIPRSAQQHLARDQAGDEALREVPKTVVVVPRLVKRAADPVKERHLRIRVVAADHQNDSVDRDERVDEVSKAELRVQADQHQPADDRRRYLQRPGKEIVAADERPQQDCGIKNQEYRRPV